MYDSKIDTYKHILQVQELLKRVIINLSDRQIKHDASKLEEPELSIFNEFTPKLANCTYGSDEYKDFLSKMRIGLEHHYACNRHHPEHYDNGIKGMNLIDLIEMMCDWLAATARHVNGNIFKSIEINQDRFGYSDELKQIFVNTIHELQD